MRLLTGISILYRLSDQTGLDNVDACVFVGETLDLACVTDDASETALEITAPDGNMVNGSMRVENVGADDEGIYVCQLTDDTGPCPEATYEMNVRVFGKQIQSLWLYTCTAFIYTYQLKPLNLKQFS